MTLPNFVATFLLEADDLLRQIESAALALELSPADPDVVGQLFRAFHTLKGSGAMVGLDAVVAFTHHVETALDHVREGRLEVSQELVTLVLAAKDHVAALIAAEAAEEGDRSEGDAAGAALAQRFAALCGPVERSAAREAAAPPVDLAEGGAASYRILFELEPSALDLGVDPGCILRDLRELGACTFHSGVENPPPPSELAANARLRWELTLHTRQPLAAVRDAFIFVEDVALIRIEPLAAPVDAGQRTSSAHSSEFEPAGAGEPAAAPATDRAGPLGPPASAAQPRPGVASGARRQGSTPPRPPPQTPAPPSSTVKRGAPPQATVRVPSERLDQLVNLVGELVINQSRLTQAFAAGGSGDMAGAVEAMDRLIGELRDSVLGIRMMPIGTTFSRFQRLARDLSAELGKEVEFVAEGGETELDKTVIDRLGDPLVHLIRNSMDHGIETPSERMDKGKPARGRLRLSAAHQGAHVVITIQDDGRGLDAAALRKKAESKGLIRPDAHLTEQQTFDLVFLPGLSTAREITNISGRGVGLDVVKRTIDELRGSITLSSVPGGGTTTRLTLPLTLAIVDGLLVEVEHDRFIIPMASVLENVDLSHSERRAKNGRNLVNVRGELIPYVRLRELFGATGPELGLEKVVIVAVEGQRLGLVVDHVLGSHQTVIQALGRFYRSVELFSGTTIMGDGRVAIIIDVAGIARHAEGRAPGRVAAAAEEHGRGARVEAGLAVAG